MGHWQTVQNQIRRRKARRLIRVSTVCKQKFLLKFGIKMKNTTNNPKFGNGLVQLIRMGNYIRHKWLKIRLILRMNSFLAGGDFCRPMITFVNSLDPARSGQTGRRSRYCNNILNMLLLKRSLQTATKE